MSKKELDVDNKKAIKKIKDLLYINTYWENVKKELIPIREMSNSYVINALRHFDDIVKKGHILSTYRQEMLHLLIKEAEIRNLSPKKLISYRKIFNLK